MAPTLLYSHARRRLDLTPSSSTFSPSTVHRLRATPPSHLPYTPPHIAALHASNVPSLSLYATLISKMTYPTFIVQPSIRPRLLTQHTLSVNTPLINPTSSNPASNPASRPSHILSPHSNPLSPPAASKPVILLFRQDLRLHDHPALTQAIKSAATASLLPLFIFDSRDYAESSLGSANTIAQRHKFLSQALDNLRQSLRKLGSDLVVRVGQPEHILPRLASQLGATAVFCHAEQSRNKLNVERNLEDTLNRAGVKYYPLWSNTLYHLDDIPYSLENLPDKFPPYKERVLAKSKLRPPLLVPDSMPGLPSVDPGQIPPLSHFGLKDPPPVNFGSHIIVGGEAEALKALSAFLAKISVTNLTFSSLERHSTDFKRLSSVFLLHGCISPRTIHAGLLKHAPRAKNAGVYLELLWNDYCRFTATMLARKAIRNPQRGIPQQLVS